MDEHPNQTIKWYVQTSFVFHSFVQFKSGKTMFLLNPHHSIVVLYYLNIYIYGKWGAHSRPWRWNRFQFRIKTKENEGMQDLLSTCVQFGFQLSCSFLNNVFISIESLLTKSFHFYFLWIRMVRPSSCFYFFFFILFISFVVCTHIKDTLDCSG